MNDKENALIAEIKIPYLKGENVKFFCKPPFTRIAEKKVPKSFIKVAKVHNGIYFEDLGGGSIGFFGLDENGKLALGAWEPE
ncbi:hypothetical protein DLM78_03340 [Leptospira stimsonii]|uniref:Uncharacterized protein n=1 Tax=Leptospira stimsonii TaxID=2202203 RepID=A0A8B6RZ79_9LEPT|nr:hypothetical protein DLM78_03340 [Leptospira stimsonii]